MIDRFGVTVDWRGATLDAVTTIALQADYSGCGYLWIPEAWGLEALSTIGHLLTVTKRIKIGTGVANVFSRSAATLGMASATLNQLAPGRFLLGLGVSGKGLVESFHGVRFEKGFQRTKEYVDTIRKIESGELVDYNGEILHLARFRLYTRPVAAPTPIFLGSIGDVNLSLAGKIADGAIVTMYPISKLGHCADLMSHAGESSKAKKIFSYIPLFITRNESEERLAKIETSKLLSFYILSMGRYYIQNLKKLGYEAAIEKVRAWGEGAKNKSSDSLSDDILEEFSLIGTPSQILGRVSKIPDGIVPVFGFRANSRESADASAKMLRELSLELASRKPRPL